MRLRYLSPLILFVAVLMTVSSSSADILAPLPTDVAAHAKRTAGAGRCFVTDVGRGTAGVAVRGTSEVELPAGRYRLHVPLALAPVGDLGTSAINISITAGETRRAV